ncbi:MAG: sigma-70 family RNA polymerase sigma factor [Verrucomicrobiae bacterium]|nr:sigma-70 family RNA polymerase sigma factor [Verrucomicrobiae bacterium]
MERVETIGTTEPTDRELVSRSQHGDVAAFEELVRRHQRRAVNVAFQLLRDEEDAVEVAQEAFVRIYRSLGGFRGECQFSTWLYQVVVNLARNRLRWWRRRCRHKTVSLQAPIDTDGDEVQPQFAAPTDPPDAVLEKTEFVRVLEQKMACLPSKFREVLVLRNVEGLSYEEIAAVLRCSVGTVKSRIARAREALRHEMKDYLS